MTRKAELVRAKLAELDATKRRLELEAPAGVAAKLLAIDGQRPPVEAELVELLRHLGALEPPLQKARAALDGLFSSIAQAHARELARTLRSERNGLLEGLGATVGAAAAGIGQRTRVLESLRGGNVTLINLAEALND